jgi:HPr kinase/phosphorylase
MLAGYSRRWRSSFWQSFPLRDTSGVRMSSGPIVQTISSGSEQRMNVPVVTVETFFERHAKSLQLKLEGKQIGFERRIREPTINRPGLALAGFYTYFAEKRVQVLGAAEQSYLKNLSDRQRHARFRALCSQKIPCIVASRGFHLAPELLSIAQSAGIAVFRSPMITM